MNNDDDLRQLFHDATADIRPQGTLDDIRAQTKKVDPMARRWFLPSLAAAAAMALVIGGAFWATRDTDSDKGSSNVATSPTAAPATPVDARIYYVGDGAQGPRLFAETHAITPGEGGIGLAAADEAIAGKPLDGDYRTEWSEGESIEGVRFENDVITVGFAGTAVADPARGMKPAEAQASVNALVRTVRAAYDTDAGVTFTINDEPADQILGVDTSSPMTGGNDDDVLALVSIGNLVNGATVEAGKLTVKGMAAAFEANVTWEILVGGDAVVDSGFATAAECCTLAPYEFTTNIALETGRYTLVVHDNDESGEGRPVNQDTKEIVVE